MSFGESKNRLSVKPREHVSHTFGSMCKASVRLSLLCVLVPTTSVEHQHSSVITSLLLLAASRLAQAKNASVQRQRPVKFMAFRRMHLSSGSPLKAPSLPLAQQNCVPDWTLRDGLVVRDLMEGSIPYRHTDRGNHEPPAVRKQPLV